MFLCQKRDWLSNSGWGRGGGSTLISFVVNLEPIQTDHKQLPLPAFHKQDVTFQNAVTVLANSFYQQYFFTTFFGSIIIYFIIRYKNVVVKKLFRYESCTLLKFVSKIVGFPNKWFKKAQLLFCLRRLGAPS